MAFARVIPPTLHEREGPDHLLVWGEQGQWLMVDEECASWLTGGNRTDSASGVHRDRPRRSPNRRDLQAIERVLASRGLLEGARASAPAQEPHRVFNITLNVTNRCNLRCTFCYNGSRNTTEAPADVIMDSLVRARPWLAPQASLIILGGEPLVAFPSLLRLLDRAQEVFSTRVLVSTNGTLVQEFHARSLASRNVEVQVSLDSPNRVEHDVIRGAGSYDRALRGVRTLVAAGIPTILSMVYTAESWCRFEAYLDLALRLGVKEARFIPLRVVGKGNHHRTHVPDQAVVFEHLLEILARRPELRSLLGRDYFSVVVKQCARSTTRSSCGVGQQVLFIDADGSVYPCPNHVSPRFRVGSVVDDEIGALLEHSSVLGSIRDQYRVEHYGACATCAFRRWCAGDCRGEARATGSASAPSVHCDELKRVYLRALWLAARRDPRMQLEKSNGPTC